MDKIFINTPNLVPSDRGGPFGTCHTMVLNGRGQSPTAERLAAERAGRPGAVTEIEQREKEGERREGRKEGSGGKG